MNRSAQFYPATLALLLVALFGSACNLPVNSASGTAIQNTALVVVTATSPASTEAPAGSTPTATLSAATLAPSDTPAPNEAATATPLADTSTPTFNPLPTLVKITELPVPGAIPGKVRYLPVVSIEASIQYIPDLSGSSANITKVTFTVRHGKTIVYQHPETNAPYCAFNDNGTKCNVFKIGPDGDDWPNTHNLVESGSYVLTIIVEDDAGDNPWSVDVPLKIKLP